MSTQATNPWFGLSMTLVGVIIGYGVAIATGGGMLPAANNAPTAQAPTPSEPAPAPTPTYDDLIPFDENEDYYKGDPNAPIVMIEYSDYECPFCQRHHPTLEQVLENYPDDIVWVYRHYPLSFHPNAKPAAEAAECVGEIAGNDAFWDFSDLVFESGPAVANHVGYVEQLGIDTQEFQDCVDSGRYSEKVDNQLAQGSTAGVRGTPGTFLQNVETGETRYISGAQPYANIKSMIDSML